VWEGGASTFPERLLTICSAVSPTHILAGGPFQIVAIIAWTFFMSALLTVFAFIKLARASSSRTGG
jgi:hypothetical protein